MKERKGIILAGGTGSRLFPITISINKQLLPVYDKPMIYYPLSTLMSAGIKDILIIVNSALSLRLFEKLLNDGSQFGINVSYKVQEKPNGIAEAFILGEEFLDGHPVALALGDNIFYSNELLTALTNKSLTNTIFGCKVADPSSYGVANLNKDGNIVGIAEKPRQPLSNWAIPGLYFYDSSVVIKAKTLLPSNRGELEITDLSRNYLLDNELTFIKLNDAFWFDCGTHDSLLEASAFVKAVQTRIGEKIGDPLCVALKNNWINN